MTNRADLALDLLADLGEAAACAHTEATLVPSVRSVISRYFSLLRLEVRLGEPAPSAPEMSRVGAETIALFGIRDSRGTLGLATLAIRAPTDTAPELTPSLLRAIGRVLAASLRQVEVLGRVAAIARRSQGDRRQLQEELDRVALPRDIVAVGPAMRAVFEEMVPLVARQDTTVLVRGETGTGKEVVARRIHALSRRASRPFLTVNCGALPEGLVESALFGHERGAFTGAATRHMGFFERSHRGTLLLDEVGELPRAAQAKLLRVLQGGDFSRVGGEASVLVDVRVIAATHRPLEAMVASGAFREDLYYRLNVFPILLPPLRERPEDLEILTLALVEKLAAKLGQSAPRVSARAMASLRAHPFPGNLRELENLLERALILSTGDSLSFPAGALPIAAGEMAPKSYEAAMRACIERALEASGGKIYGPNGAAAALGLKPTTLQSKLKKLGIRLPP